MLLTADLHLTDAADDEYRWTVFDEIKKQRPKTIYILGDLTDRKDRHSAILVNRIVENLRDLAKSARVTVIMGNHDQPLNGPPFWAFLGHIDNLKFITKPTAQGQLLLLPYTADPKRDWNGFPWHLYRCLMMHQTVRGVDLGHGRKADHAPRLPLFPPGIKVYSGDIHYPQTIRGITYVGAPHRVRYGDDHETRMLILQEDWSIDRVVPIRTLRKCVATVRKPEDLETLSLSKGDRLRVRLQVTPEDIGYWPLLQTQIQEWAAERGVTVNAMEAILPMEERNGAHFVNHATSPRQILTEFAKAEGLSKTTLAIGEKLLNEEIIQ